MMFLTKDSRSPSPSTEVASCSQTPPGHTDPAQRFLSLTKATRSHSPSTEATILTNTPRSHSTRYREPITKSHNHLRKLQSLPPCKTHTVTALRRRQSVWTSYWHWYHRDPWKIQVIKNVSEMIVRYFEDGDEYPTPLNVCIIIGLHLTNGVQHFHHNYKFSCFWWILPLTLNF